MKRLWPLAVATCVVLAAPASAGEEENVITAQPHERFDPGSIEIDQGETVTFQNAGGTHNVRWTKGDVVEQPADPSSEPWSFTRTFDEPGSYIFYCELHGAPPPTERPMNGVVEVRDASGEVPPPPKPVPSIKTKRKVSLKSALDGISLRAACENGCNMLAVLFDGEKIAGQRYRSLREDGSPTKILITLGTKTRSRLAKRTEPFKLRLRATSDNGGGAGKTIKRKITVKP